MIPNRPIYTTTWICVDCGFSVELTTSPKAATIIFCPSCGRPVTREAELLLLKAEMAGVSKALAAHVEGEEREE